MRIIKWNTKRLILYFHAFIEYKNDLLKFNFILVHRSFVVFIGGHATFYFITNYRLSAMEMASEIRLDYSYFNFIVNGVSFCYFHDQEIFIANCGSNVSFCRFCYRLVCSMLR